MVQARSSQFPVNDRDPQKLVDVFQAGADDCRKGVQSIYKSTVNACHLTLPEMIKKLDKAVKNPTANLAH